MSPEQEHEHATAREVAELKVEVEKRFGAVDVQLVRIKWTLWAFAAFQLLPKLPKVEMPAPAQAVAQALGLA
jgi:hypothetical protein